MRILVVEDSAKMAGLLKLGLEREGYAVDVTASAVDAVWLACEHGYDAVVLDVILDAAGQQADGFEVCRRLRQAGCWVPVLMVTARDAVRDRVRGLDAGADDYLPKPFYLRGVPGPGAGADPARGGGQARGADRGRSVPGPGPARGATRGRPHRPDQDRVRAARVPHAARR